MARWLRSAIGFLALVAICLVSVTAVAQFGESKGNLYGKVVDEQGGVLPGVTVTLSGQGAPTIATTRRARGVPVPEPLARNVHGQARPDGIRRRHARERRGQPRPEHGDSGDAEALLGGRGGHGDERDSGHRHAQGRDGRGDDERRAAETFRRAATRGCCCRAFRASRWTGSTWPAPRAASSPPSTARGRSPGRSPSTASTTRTWRPSARRTGTTTSRRSRKCRS